MYQSDFNRSFNIMQAIVITGIAFVAISIVGGVCISFVGGAFPNYSEGERAGTVYKVSKKGLIFKSYEGEMNLGGMSADANGQVTANAFKFSVQDPALIVQLDEAAASGKRVTMKYHQYFIKPLKIDTPYVIEEVKFIGEK